MATEASTVADAAAGSVVRQPDSLRMHVTRPKSAKGRTRPCLRNPQGLGPCAPGTPASPLPAHPSESLSSQKRGAYVPAGPARGTPELPKRLPHVSLGASPSLSKYPVLPSINRRSREQGAVDAAKKVGSPGSIQARRQEGAAQICSLERKFILRTKSQGAPGAANLEEPSDQEPRLLLAVRSPSGRRFVRHFRPTDDLQTVVAVAEQKNRATYGRCSIETMEVPRRRFPDLTKSLQECGIRHMSVLGIAREGWP